MMLIATGVSWPQLVDHCTRSQLVLPVAICHNRNKLWDLGSSEGQVIDLLAGSAGKKRGIVPNPKRKGSSN